MNRDDGFDNLSHDYGPMEINNTKTSGMGRVSKNGLDFP